MISTILGGMRHADTTHPAPRLTNSDHHTSPSIAYSSEPVTESFPLHDRHPSISATLVARYGRALTVERAEWWSSTLFVHLPSQDRRLVVDRERRCPI